MRSGITAAHPHRLPVLSAVALACALTLAVGSCGDGGASSAPPTITGAAAQRGEQVAANRGCGNCHTDDGGRSTGPTWKDLAGSEVELDDGTKVRADDTYLAVAVTDPKVQVVKGFASIMPSYDLTDAEVADLVAYLRELSPGATGS